jgi:putative ABC transport system permease protein
MAAGILSSAGAFGLLLAAIGVYGVVSYSVAQRIREMGIRAALGADRFDIIWLVLRDGVRVLLLGIAAGGALTWTAVRAAATLVLPLPAIDSTTLVIVPAVFGTVILAACLVPAWRASRVDPKVALRHL